jgi:hypothetical protein
MYLYKPFLEWDDGAEYLYPDSAREAYRDDRNNERYRHIAANGQALTYKVGGRQIIQNTFRWLDDDKVDEFYDFYDDVVGGAEFVYHTDDSLIKCGAPIRYCGDGHKCGDTVSGTADVATTVTLDQDELTPEDETVYGYSMITLRMRVVV